MSEAHLSILKQGTHIWNRWRDDYPDIAPDLREANLGRADLLGANLSRADLYHAHLSEAQLSGASLREAGLSETYFCKADLAGADLSHSQCFKTDFDKANLKGATFRSAQLREVDLWGADLEGADLRGATLWFATLNKANLIGANLEGADLSWAILVGTNFTGANLNDCYVYGISAWDLTLTNAKQNNLIISRMGQPRITVDNLEVAQFVHLLLNNEKVRQVMDTITSKMVLILGSFTPERKQVLDAIRDALRQRDYLPVLFDFVKPASRDLTETISTLAHMSRFVIADITGARSMPQELQCIVPNLPSVPIQPLLLRSEHEYGMFEHFKRYPWVLDPYLYGDVPELIAALEENVIVPAEARVAARG
jgi:uncharacterized protein YjbI with pentapeptide repeats